LDRRKHVKLSAVLQQFKSPETLDNLGMSG
jgi:hypothetical protein